MLSSSINNKFILIVNKIIILWWIKKFILIGVKHKLNNETIGQSAEYSICINSNIKCYIVSTRINIIIVSRFNKLLETDNILQQFPKPITPSGGCKMVPWTLYYKMENY